MKILITILMLCISTVVFPQSEYTAKSPSLENWIYRLLVFLLAVGLIYVAYRFRINQIKQEEKLRSDHEIRMNKLENDAFHNQLNPHFIFNSLNTINSFINKNETATSNQYITKFSKLLRLILEHSRQRKITLAEELNVVDLYLQVERIRFENKFNYQINIDPDIDADVTEISPLIIQPFVENAILHGLLPLLSEGLLQINLQRKNNTLVCTIEDNGIGRSQSICNKQLSPKKSKSYGIGTTLKRIELFNKDHNINRPVIITDLADSNNNASGTKVEIILAWVQSF